MKEDDIHILVIAGNARGKSTIAFELAEYLGRFQGLPVDHKDQDGTLRAYTLDHIERFAALRARLKERGGTIVVREVSVNRAALDLIEHAEARTFKG